MPKLCRPSQNWKRRPRGGRPWDCARFFGSGKRARSRTRSDSGGSALLLKAQTSKVRMTSTICRAKQHPHGRSARDRSCGCCSRPRGNSRPSWCTPTRHTASPQPAPFSCPQFPFAARVLCPLGDSQS
ncbi:hypothetical protein T492DRAFT_292180 [Pavlovales sp. CCMP2436]|nr:hypothetical protein T492DRAFT_292180 [Pavlovales sp. CCMP2436]